MNVTLTSELDVRLASRQPTQRWFLPKRTRWKLLSNFELTIGYIDSSGKYVTEDFVVPRGFEFDAASIPFFLWWRFQPTYQPSFKASCFHDYCYDELFRHFSKEFADEAFMQIMLEEGAPRHVAYLFFLGVSLFGEGGW